MTTATFKPGALSRRVSELLAVRAQEIRLIAQDPTLLIGLLASGAFIFAFILWPLARVAYQGFFTLDDRFSVEFFRRYLDAQYGPQYRAVFWDTVQMGVYTATGATALGFLLAYTVVRCDIPFKRFVHALILLPTISPPFAIAVATILLFGRNGFVTRQILGIDYSPYGLHGLAFVQIITFFSIAYLIIRGLLERIEPSMEEAALSLGASKWHIFRTVTLPLLTPGIAASFLLMFVESLADLAKPLFIAGNTTVLSAQIWIAVNGEFDQQKGAALSLALLLPTLTVFLIQRYWVSRRSYIAVTGKPTGGSTSVFVKEPVIRALFIGLSSLLLLLVLALYGSIFAGSITRVWGIDYTLDLRHYGNVFQRGLKAILDTTFLSAVATPIAGVAGMVVAYLVVRKRFSGKELLDFGSTLGGAVPGTILGIGYIIAFIKAPTIIVIVIYVALAYYAAAASARARAARLALFAGGTLVGMMLTWLTLGYDQRLPFLANAFGDLIGQPFMALPVLDFQAWLVMLAGMLAALAAAALLFPARPFLREGLGVRLVPLVMAVYLLLRQFVPTLTEPLGVWARTQGGDFWPRFGASLAAWINLFFQPPLAILGFTYIALSVAVARAWQPRARGLCALLLLGIGCALTFYGEPLALVGSPYIILAAYAVRSLPASVRAGMAALQQIDPSIEEASTSLGADAQLTFRRVTLPLVLPAFVAGLIFSFARHMTSLSAIIFLSTPKWPILTALILSEVEQGGMSLAAAYSMVLIFIVLGAIGLVYLWAGRAFRAGGAETVLGAG
ncbi:MAG: ABC transporter permease subunit [Chloroflexi bacterium]|nr:ABC transporter permease subunit [Chloroflexota bacterium]